MTSDNSTHFPDDLPPLRADAIFNTGPETWGAVSLDKTLKRIDELMEWIDTSTNTPTVKANMVCTYIPSHIERIGVIIRQWRKDNEDRRRGEDARAAHRQSLPEAAASGAQTT